MLLDEVQLCLAELLEDRLDVLDGLPDDLLGGCRGAHLDLGPAVRGGLGLDHEDGDVAVVLEATGDDHLEDGLLLELLEGGERDPRAVTQHRVAGGGGRTGERDAREHRGQRGAVHGDHVVGVDLLGLQDRVDDLDLVAQALGERRAQRAVGQPARQDGVLRRATLTLEERAGDAPGGVHPLLELDREREETEELLGVGARGRGGEDLGVAHRGDDGAAGLLCEESCFEGELSSVDLDGELVGSELAHG